MKEIKNDSHFVRIGVYVGIALMVGAAIWYLYRALTLIH